MTQTRPFRKRLFGLAVSLLIIALPRQGGAEDLRLAAPTEMVTSGFLAHLLPRFKLKHRIAVLPVAVGDEAELALVSSGQKGARVFGDSNGTEYRLVLQRDTPEAAKFRDWLQSDPGKAAVTSFPRGGPPAYTTELAAEIAAPATEVTGDAALGSKLAITHCGRCHVVDQRNRMGGIGSTPSFAAMRARGHWFDLFTAYWSENPHPSFTEVIGVTEPFSVTNITHVAPVRLTLEEIDAIVAFVETLTPLDLGRPVQVD